MVLQGQIRDFRVFDLNWKTASIRYGVVLFLALTNAFLRIDMGAPRTGFEFPWRIFFFGFVFAFTVCTSSWVVTTFAKRILFSKGKIDLRNTAKFLAVNVLVALIVYTMLYITLNGQIYPRHFAIYFLLTIAVVSIENLIYLLYCTIENAKDLEEELNHKQRTSLVVPTGQKHLTVSLPEIAYVHLSDGIVTLHTDNGLIVTQFGSMEEVEMLLPKGQFFRANRQFILNRAAVKEIKKDTNRKLKLEVNGHVPATEISVSRYKSKELMDWMRQA